MKRFKSNDDVEFSGERGVVKDWVRRDEDSGFNRSFRSNKSHYKKPCDSGNRKLVSFSGSRHERLDDDRENSRMVRNRVDYDVDAIDRRKGHDRQRDGKERGSLSSSPRVGYGTDKTYKSEGFSTPRRDFPKGFRSERDKSRRDNSVSSWRRYGSGKDGDDVARSGIGVETLRGSRLESEKIGKVKVKSPQVVRDVKSPAWSKESGSERSKNVEVKKSEDKLAESGGDSSEREEGELEPDPCTSVPLSEEVVKKKAVVELNLSQNKLASLDNEKDCQDTDGISVGRSEERAEIEKSKIVKDFVTKNDNVQDSRDTQENEETGETENDVKEVSNERGSKDDDAIGSFDDDLSSLQENKETKENNIEMKEDKDDSSGNVRVMDRNEVPSKDDDAIGSFDDNLSSLQENKETKENNIEMKEDKDGSSGNVRVMDRNEVPSMEEMTQTWKDKGKSTIVSSSSNIHFEEINMEVEFRARDLLASNKTEMEGPSTRGFQFFSSDPIKKQEKVQQSSQTRPNDNTLVLDLSLSLPNVLLPIGAQNRGQAPGSPSHGGSVQSFMSSLRTNSDTFMPSMSYSGSQHITHNLSCSLTNDAYDFEKSVKSKPLFQGVDWSALSLHENKGKEIPLYQGTSSRPKITVENPKELERQLSLNRSLPGEKPVMSQGNGSMSSKEQRQVSTQKKDPSVKRSFNPIAKEENLVFGADLGESAVSMIVSEPLRTMARRFSGMTDHHIACLKNFVLDIITNPGKQWQLNTLQRVLLKRSDTLDMLVNANRTQLEILVALKTGLQEFLMQKQEISSSLLAEIFLNTRCRNLSCKSLLPVDECDCKICAKRDGFCRECMCLVCSKFDNASNTCSWVGCDVCLHWCHADCGLKESLIRNGHSTEIQFHCVACGHPSEMFGFVKEVFLNFLKEWTADNLCRELDYVRKIFASSKDTRGKQLHELSAGLMSVLVDGANYQEVQNHLMRFFTETDSSRHGNFPIVSRSELPAKNKESRTVSLPKTYELPTKDHNKRKNSIAGSHGSERLNKSTYPEKSTPLENMISGFENSQGDQYTTNVDFRSNVQNQPVFDELESLVRIKHAEANMFQKKADDARKEAEALKNISLAKTEQIEREYSSRIEKLRLAEAEEMRRQKLEELQDVERAHHEYFGMKMRMETNIKDLLLKMEATRKNLWT